MNRLFQMFDNPFSPLFLNSGCILIQKQCFKPAQQIILYIQLSHTLSYIVLLKPWCSCNNWYYSWLGAVFSATPLESLGMVVEASQGNWQLPGPIVSLGMAPLAAALELLAGQGVCHQACSWVGGGSRDKGTEQQPQSAQRRLTVKDFQKDKMSWKGPKNSK